MWERIKHLWHRLRGKKHPEIDKILGMTFVSDSRIPSDKLFILDKTTGEIVEIINFEGENNGKV